MFSPGPRSQTAIWCTFKKGVKHTHTHTQTHAPQTKENHMVAFPLRQCYSFPHPKSAGHSFIGFMWHRHHLFLDLLTSFPSDKLCRLSLLSLLTSGHDIVMGRPFMCCCVNGNTERETFPLFRASLRLSLPPLSSNFHQASGRDEPPRPGRGIEDGNGG